MSVTLNVGFAFIVTPFIVAAGLPHQESLTPNNERGTVTLLVADTFGLPIRPVRIQLDATGFNPECTYGKGESRCTLHDVDLGYHGITVLAPGFERYQKTIHVTGKPQTLRIGLQVGIDHAGREDSDVHGSISGCKAEGLSVRLLPIYDSEILESAVTADGSFTFGGVMPGSYVVMLMRDVNVIDVKRVSFRRPQSKILLRCAGNGQ